MVLRTATIALLALAILTVGMTSASAYSYSTYQQPGNNLISVFGVADLREHNAGFGAAYDKVNSTNNTLADFTYTHLPGEQTLQLAQLYGVHLDGYPVYFGFAVGYAKAKSDDPNAYEGVVTGLQAVLLQGQTHKGLSFDLRMATMTNGLSPIKWFTNPDTLWLGAGVSYGW
jgi:hypothetical protein